MKRTAMLLLLIYALLVGWMSWANGLGRTEVGHLGAAAYFLHSNNFDVFHVNPPLTRIVISVPLELCEPNCSFQSYSTEPLERCEWSIGEELIASNSKSKIRWLTFWARLSLLPFILFGGYFGFLLASAIYGNAAGLIFLVMFCFSPFMLTWGATVCPDATAASLGIVALHQFRAWLCSPSTRSSLVAGITLGLLPLAKLTWIVAFIVWPIMWLIWRSTYRTKTESDQPDSRAPFKQLLAILFVALLVINGGYGLDGSCKALGQYRFHSKSLAGQYDSNDTNRFQSGNRFRGTFLGSVLVPVPAEFLQGIDTQKYDFERGLPSYLGGEWSDKGWWYFYLFALATKEPVGTWCLFILSCVSALVWRKRSRSFRDGMLLIVPFGLILVFVSSQSGFSVNTRYVILALPFLYLWLAGIGIVFDPQSQVACRQLFKVGGLASLSWFVLSSLLVFPHSLSYFNEFAGGSKNGGRLLLGSNFDWGQDVWYLKSWLDRHPDVVLDGKMIYSAYPNELTGIHAVGIPPSGPSTVLDPEKTSIARNSVSPMPGWYALSADCLYEREQRFRYFIDHFEPVARVGYSISLYHITHAEANAVRQKLGLPPISSEERVEE